MTALGVAAHALARLLETYREFQNPANHRAIENVRTPTTTTAPIPVSFPESYPFSLMAALPKTQKGTPSVSTNEHNRFFNPGLGETAIVFLSLVLSAPTNHIYNFFESSYDIEGKDNFASLLVQFFKVTTSILDNDAWPSSWLNVNILTHKVLIKVMDPISTLLKSIFIPPPSATKQFRVDLWRDAFYMLLKLLSSDQLVIEEFTAQVSHGSLSWPRVVDAFCCRNDVRSGVSVGISVVKVQRYWDDSGMR